MIPKLGKDLRRRKNWRSLVLQEVIYKLIAGAIGQRLNIALDVLIHRAQTGFIPGRSMQDNVKIIYSIVELAKRLGKKAS